MKANFDRWPKKEYRHELFFATYWSRSACDLGTQNVDSYIALIISMRRFAILGSTAKGKSGDPTRAPRMQEGCTHTEALCWPIRQISAIPSCIYYLLAYKTNGNLRVVSTEPRWVGGATSKPFSLAGKYIYAPSIRGAVSRTTNALSESGSMPVGIRAWIAHQAQGGIFDPSSSRREKTPFFSFMHIHGY